MAIDASIYAQQRSPDFVGGIQKGMSLGQMVQENNQRKQDLQKQKDIKDAFGAGMTTNPDGTTSFNSGATLSALTKKGYGQEAYELQQQIKTQEAQAQKANMEKMRAQVDMISQLLGGVKDQATYDFAKQQAQKFGLNVADLPPAYDPKYISQLNQQVLTAKERMDLQFKKDDQGLNREKFDWQKNTDQQRLNLDKQKAMSEKKEKANEGQKTVDREFAKDYNEWTSGGSKIARSEINKLSGIIQSLRNGETTTGGFSGMFPDRMTSANLLKARSDVQSTVMNSLRAILGAQFTEKEGERIIKNTWNESDTTENNISRLTRLVSDLENQANDKDVKSKHFEQSGGTLTGFKTMSQDAPKKGPSAIGFYSEKALTSMSDDQLAKLYKQAGGK